MIGMFRSLLPAILWAGVIFILSAIPNVKLPESWWEIFSVDKLGHAVVYGVFTFLLLRGFSKIPQHIQKSIRTALIISIMYGIAMEVMQYAFFPNRYFENLDIIANIIGSFIGLFSYNFFNKKS